MMQELSVRYNYHRDLFAVKAHLKVSKTMN